MKKENLKINKNIEIFKPFKEGNYKMPTEVIFGRGILDELKNFPLIKNSQKIILVFGDHFKNSYFSDKLSSDLKELKKEILIYPEKIVKSDIKTVNNLIKFCRHKDLDIILAIGGGTVIDASKCAAALFRNDGLIKDYIVKKTKVLKNKSLDLIVLPTTAGTGSEVTPWATIWDTKKKKKYSLTSPFIFPKLAVIDPQLTDSLPPAVTAETGFDALAQALESYWSVNHNPTSDKFALLSIKLCLDNLEKVVNNPDENSRDKMAKASMLTGLAFSNTQTTICHAVSYPITAYFNIAHGQAVAITLPEFLKFILRTIEPKRRKFILKTMGEINISDAAQKINLLMRKTGLKTKLSELGIKKKNIDLIVREGFDPDRANNVPKIPTRKELKEILEKIWS